MRGAFIVLVLLIAFVWILASTHRETATATVPLPASTETAAVAEAVEATTTSFSEVGTLVFYPNNMGPIPYLLYETSPGHLASKALNFSELPSTDFSLWSGGRVSVEGIPYAEHVVVTHISYLGPP